MVEKNVLVHPPVLEDTWASALATLELVGRKDIQAKIETAITDETTASVFYITGEGGIGKTRLVSRFLSYTPPGFPKPILTGMVDLDDISTNNVEGLVKRIQEVLTAGQDETVSSSFSDYLRERQIWEEHRVTKSAGDIKEQWTKMINEFSTGLKKLAEKYRIVLILDTGERLFHRENPVIKELELTEIREYPTVLDWLIYPFFPDLPKMVILLAGRPGPEGEYQSFFKTLFKTLEDASSGKNFYQKILPGLTEEEALFYFDALIRAAEKTNSPWGTRVVEVAQLYTEKDRRVTFHCLRDEGVTPHIRPILLALAIDHLITAGQPLKVFNSTIEEAKNLTPKARQGIKYDLGLSLINSLRHSSYRADRVLVALSTLRQGADAELLAKILADEDTTEERIAINNAIDEVRQLSFVKPRGDNRLVLHDEMFTLLQIHETDQYSPERERILVKMEAFFKERIEQIRKLIFDLTTTLIESEADKIDQEILDKIVAARGDIESLILEDLYYRLRHDAKKGFQAFYRYIEEAVTEGNEQLGVQLQAEIYGFLAERDPYNHLRVVDGLSRDTVRADAAIRQVKWLWVENNTKEARNVINRLKTDKRDLIDDGDDLPIAELDSWHGYLEAYAASYDQANRLIQQAIDQIIQRTGHTIRSAGVLARAYNNLGYLHRLAGQTHQAIEAYQQALRYWRAAHFRTAQADTLNNLAYASALIGDFEAADRYGRDGVNLRKEVGPRMPTLLSLNTLALIDILSNYLDRGVRRCLRANKLFRILGNIRGIGLAQLTLAEAKRRISTSTVYQKQGQTAQLLAEASQHATEAARIFTEQSPEPDRLAASLIEVGCAFRDWAILRQQNPVMFSEEEKLTDQFYSVASLVTRSEQTFQKALEAAQEVDDLYVDILLNLALLYYLKGFRLNLVSTDKTLDLLNNRLFPQIETAILEHYRKRISLNQPTDLFALNDQSMFIVFLGRLELTRAHIAFSQFRQNDNQNIDHLKEAARHFALALAYLNRYSNKDFRQMRRAKQQLYERLTKLKAQELNVVFDSVAAVDQQYHWPTSPMSEFLRENFGVTGTISMTDI